MSLPCQPYATVGQLCPPNPSTIVDCDNNETPIVQQFSDEFLLTVASRLIYKYSCEQFPGVCPYTIRPCSCKCPSHDCCRCDTPFIALANLYPVVSVLEVKIDGVILPNTDYRLDEFNRLVRTDGFSWPSSQNVLLDDTNVDTFSIRYETGRLPTDDIVYATIILAEELRKSCTKQPCDLPEGVKTIMREGVVMEMISEDDIVKAYSSKLTGVKKVDQILAAYQPCKKRSRPVKRVFFAGDDKRIGTRSI